MEPTSAGAPLTSQQPGTSKRGVKTTVELPEDVWRAAKIRAMDDFSDLRTVIIAALRTHLGLSEVEQ